VNLAHQLDLSDLFKLTSGLFGSQIFLLALTLFVVLAQDLDEFRDFKIW
jgi:hypothetical protein